MKKRSAFSGFWIGNILAILLALLPFASRLIYRSISIDTEIMINAPQEMLLSWLYHERPGLVVSKYLFGQTVFHYEASILFALLFLAASCLLWQAALCRLAEGRKKGFLALFPLFFLTHPAMTEQFHFLLQSMEVAWAVFLCLAAVVLVSYLLTENGVWWLWPAGLLAAVWSFSSYQALVALYIAAAAALYLWQYDHREGKSGWWRLAIQHVLFFLLAFGISQAAAKVGLYLSTGSFRSTAYVAGMRRWGTKPAVECFRDLYHYGIQILTGAGVFYTLAYTAALFGTMLIVLYRFRHGRGCAAYGIAALILYVSPFLLPLYAGGPDQVRAQLALSFTIAFGWCYLIHLLYENFGKKYWLQRGACLAAVLFIGLQFRQTVQLTGTAYQVYQQECKLTWELAKAIEKTGAPSTSQIYFAGRWSPLPAPGLVQGETIGWSFYEWDQEKECGSTERILGLWRTLGYEYTAALEKAETEEIPCWPSAGSVYREGDQVIVKLPVP